MAGGQFLGFGADVGNITTSAIETVIGVAPRNRNMISWEKPLLRKIEETAAEHASSLNDSEREQLQTILEAVQPSSSGSQELTTMDDELERPPSVVLEAVTWRGLSETPSSSTVLEVPRNLGPIPAGRRFSDALQTFNPTRKRKSVTIGSVNVAPLRRHSYQPQSSVHRERLLKPNRERKNMRRLSEIISDWERPSRSSLSHMYSFARRESVYIARKKLAGLKDWALDLLAKLKSRQGMAIRRETRATKLVATVMVVFLVCWLPFFTLNMIKVYKLFYNTWPPELEGIFHWFTALGYLNSSLNFFIYSAINQKFRSTFRKIVGLKRQNKSWMLPPKEVARRRATYGCGCGPFHKVKKTTLRKASSAGIIGRRFSVNKPEIIIDEVSVISPNNVSISNGGNTTFRSNSSFV
uniref:G_PROTEIN_RECEP_F1_2 domain-containing protein n=1 Tax=Panagrellus redivivus TaxID=6233 RepID=A0A7E4V840_PANRE